MKRLVYIPIALLVLCLTPAPASAKLGLSLGADLGLSAGTKPDLFCNRQLSEQGNYFCACTRATGSENRFPQLPAAVMASVGSVLSSTGEQDSFEVKCSHMHNPYTTLLISFVPGLALHGAGHYYIGEKNTAYLLLGVEALSILTYTLALAAGSGNPEGGVSDQTKERSEVVMGIGAAVFVGTWLYDVVGAQVTLSHKRRQYGCSLEVIKENNTTYAILSFPM
jgi:hypothetical protein